MRIIFVLLLTACYLLAKGTTAGTVINNIATLDFVVDDQQQHIQSNVASDTVAQLIDLHIDALDTQPVRLLTSEILPPLSFQITNTGNGPDRIELSYLLDDTSDFTVDDLAIYIDSNNNRQFDENDKQTTQFSLAEDEHQTFFLLSKETIVSHIVNNPGKYLPKTSHKQSSQCIVDIKARSLIGGSGIRGKIHPKKGIKGVDAVDGEFGGVVQSKGIWEYKASKSLQIKQTSTVHNQFGNSEPISGAVITYHIETYAPPNVSAKEVVYKNPIPKNTTYVKNSLRLNQKKLTDCKDSDKGTYDDKNNLIIVDIGSVMEKQTQTIEFQVKIK